MNTTENPEIGKKIDIGNCVVNFQDEGQGEAIILLHGSGPGVTGYANWRLLIPVLAKDFRVLAPDVVGFGYTSHPEGFVYNLENWIDWTIRFMDALGIEKAGFVGNSFGGALALAIAAKHPDRVSRFVMMGAAGIEFQVTEGLRKVWGYTPSFENMRELMNTFAFEGEKISDEIVESRYQASIRPGYQEAYSQLFPEPMQEKLDALPEGRNPTKEDWSKMSRAFRADIDRRMMVLGRLRDNLDSCIGCGCLSLKKCAIYNPQDQAGRRGTGPRYVIGAREEWPSAD